MQRLSGVSPLGMRARFRPKPDAQSEPVLQDGAMSAHEPLEPSTDGTADEQCLADRTRTASMMSLAGTSLAGISSATLFFDVGGIASVPLWAEILAVVVAIAAAALMGAAIGVATSGNRNTACTPEFEAR